MIAYLGGTCVRCGTTESLQFDHIDATTKSFNVSKNWSRSWVTLTPELDKCQLLCRDHHREKTQVSGDNTGGGWNRWAEVQHGKNYTYSSLGCRCEECKAAKRASRKKVPPAGVEPATL